MESESQRVGRPAPAIGELAAIIILVAGVETRSDVGEVVVDLLGDLLGRSIGDERRKKRLRIVERSNDERAAGVSGGFFSSAFRTAGDNDGDEDRDSRTPGEKVANSAEPGRS
jgi:hypothetical protein